VSINNGKIGMEKPAVLDRGQVRQCVERVIRSTPVIDIHTHLYSPEFGELGLSGIDEVLTYHYLAAETFRSSPVSPEKFWLMDKPAQADLVWKTLFVENTPLSEATRGVLTILKAFGLNASAPDLTEAREYFRSRNFSAHLDDILRLAGVTSVVMTNDPFDAKEKDVWENKIELDARFRSSLRLDRLLNDWQKACARLGHLGCDVREDLGGETIAEVRRFLDNWIALMQPVYLAISLPDDFTYPAGDARDVLLRHAVLPAALEHGLPFAPMIGVRRRVNPALRAAGDGVGRADMRSVEYLCRENPGVKFLTTFLSRENQHELCVAARKFSNLMPFGCWWFLNNPSTVEEITRERIEMLGTSFIPQHSDARVLEQLIYKWSHSRELFAKTFADAYERTFDAGRAVNETDIERDVQRLFSGNFNEWITPSAVRMQKILDGAKDGVAIESAAGIHASVDQQ
jgi:hypothetical protein